MTYTHLRKNHASIKTPFESASLFRYQPPMDETVFSIGWVLYINHQSSIYYTSTIERGIQWRARWAANITRLKEVIHQIWISNCPGYQTSCVLVHIYPTSAAHLKSNMNQLTNKTKVLIFHAGCVQAKFWNPVQLAIPMRDSKPPTSDEMV